MSEETKDHLLIPLLITAVAAYFGFKGKSEKLAEIAKDLTNRAITDQTRNNYRERVARKYRKNRNNRELRDRYYS